MLHRISNIVCPLNTIYVDIFECGKLTEPFLPKHCVFIMPFMSSTLCGRGVHSPMVEGKFLRKKDHEFPTFFFSAPNGSGVRISRH